MSENNQKMLSRYMTIGAISCVVIFQLIGFGGLIGGAIGGGVGSLLGAVLY